MRRAASGLAILAVVCAAACGGSGSGVSKRASPYLSRDVAAVRAAVSKRDGAHADAALATLRHDVLTLRAQGLLTERAADRIVTDAATVATELAAELPSTTTSSTMRPTSTSASTDVPVTAPPPPARKHEHGHGRKGGD